MEISRESVSVESSGQRRQKDESTANGVHFNTSQPQSPVKRGLTNVNGPVCDRCTCSQSKKASNTKRRSSESCAQCASAVLHQKENSASGVNHDFVGEGSVSLLTGKSSSKPNPVVRYNSNDEGAVPNSLSKTRPIATHSYSCPHAQRSHSLCSQNAQDDDSPSNRCHQTATRNEKNRIGSVDATGIEMDIEGSKPKIRTKSQRRIAKAIVIVSFLLLSMSVALVAITLLLSQHIDEMVRRNIYGADYLTTVPTAPMLNTTSSSYNNYSSISTSISTATSLRLNISQPI